MSIMAEKDKIRALEARVKELEEARRAFVGSTFKRAAGRESGRRRMTEQGSGDSSRNVTSVSPSNSPSGVAPVGGVKEVPTTSFVAAKPAARLDGQDRDPDDERECLG